FVPVGTEPQAVVVAPGHLLLDRQPVGLHELSVQCWALPPRPDPVRAHIEQAFAQRGDRPPQQFVECSGVLATLELVLHNRAVGVIDAGLAERMAAKGLVSVLHTTLGLQGSALGLVTLKRRRMRPNAALVYRAVHQQIEQDLAAQRKGKVPALPPSPVPAAPSVGSA